MKPNSTQEELRNKLCRVVNIYPDELKDNLPNNIGTSQMEALEKVVNSEVLSVLDRLEKKYLNAEDWWATNVAPEEIEAIRKEYS